MHRIPTMGIIIFPGTCVAGTGNFEKIRVGNNVDLYYLNGAIKTLKKN